MGGTYVQGEGFYPAGTRKAVETTDSSAPKKVDAKRDFRRLEDMQPGEKWTRLDGQERTVPERRPVLAQKEVVGCKEETCMDGRKIMAPVYK